MISFQLTSTDSDYPPLLREIHDPPSRLWGGGDRTLLSKGLRVAIVGARECTPYGEESAFRLARDLADAGVVVVSGLALGIDSAAHRGALEGCGGKGTTVAVLGCGMDLNYPVENFELKKKIASQGVMITEYPPGTGTSRWTFPQRNRIISGLSSGVVVVEAGLKSGSLITANFALEQGREVFAVPGNINSPKSAGTSRLIQNGAKLVTKVEDILDELKYQTVKRVSSEDRPLFREEEGASGEEQRILALLSNGSQNMDELIDSTGYSLERLSSLLVELEIGGRVQSLPGGRYIRRGD